MIKKSGMIKIKMKCTQLFERNRREVAEKTHSTSTQHITNLQFQLSSIESEKKQQQQQHRPNDENEGSVAIKHVDFNVKTSF